MRSQAITIRSAQADDAPAMAAIYADSIARGDATLERVAPPASAYAAAIDDPRYVVLVAVDDAQVVGWARVKPWSDRAGYATTGETSIFLAETHLRRGIGRRLYTALLDAARARGLHHLVARMFAHHHASVGLHRALGFEMVGVQREVGRMGDRWVDVAIMQRLLGGVRAAED